MDLEIGTVSARHAALKHQRETGKYWTMNMVSWGLL